MTKAWSHAGPSKLERLDHLADSIYDAGTGVASWASFGQQLVKEFNSFSLVLSINAPNDVSPDFLYLHNFSARAQEAYAAHWVSKDPWMEVGLARGPSSKPFIGSDLVATNDFINSAIYVDFARRELAGVCYLVAAALPLDGGAIGTIGINRPREAGDFKAEDAAALEYLLPHLRRGMLLRRRLDLQTGQERAERRALDGLATGVLLLDRSGTVVFANVAAEAILRQRDGLSMGQYHALLAAKSDETAQLRRLIGGCSLPGGGGAMRLTRPSGLEALEAIVIPVRRRLEEKLPAQATAILYLRDPAAELRPAPAALRSLLGLTAAETELALRLLAGATLDDVAAGRGVSRETVRSQLKELFRKTETSRQADLLRKLAASIAAIVGR